MRAAYLHGFLGDPEVWPTTGGVRIALPGHGGGPVLATWDDNVDAVAHAIGRCDVVVGYSLGGRIATALVVAGHVPRAVLISANPGLSASERGSRRAADAQWAALLRSGGLAAFLDAWEAQPLFANQARVEVHRRDARRRRRLAHDPAQLARVLEVMGAAAMPDYRHHIDQRFQFIVGSGDAKYVAIARSLSANVTVVEDAGHDPLFEQPSALARSLAVTLND